MRRLRKLAGNSLGARWATAGPTRRSFSIPDFLINLWLIEYKAFCDSRRLNPLEDLSCVPTAAIKPLKPTAGINNGSVSQNPEEKIGLKKRGRALIEETDP